MQKIAFKNLQRLYKNLLQEFKKSEPAVISVFLILKKIIKRQLKMLIMSLANIRLHLRNKEFKQFFLELINRWMLCSYQSI